MINRKNLMLSLTALSLSSVAILVYSAPIFAYYVTDQTNTIYKLNSIKGEARFDGIVVSTPSIEFTETPATDGPYTRRITQ